MNTPIYIYIYIYREREREREREKERERERAYIAIMTPTWKQVFYRLEIYLGQLKKHA